MERFYFWPQNPAASLFALWVLSQIFLYAAEINVVKKKHLWPRSLVDAPTPGDEEVFRQRAKIEQRRPDENIRVSFDKSPRTG